MEINRKIKIVLIAITVLIVGYSMYYSFLPKQNAESHAGSDRSAVQEEIRSRQEFDKLSEELNGDIQAAQIADTYIALVDGTLDVTEEVKLLKTSLRAEAERMKEFSAALSEETERLAEMDDKLMSYSERLKVLQGSENRSALNTASESASALKIKLD